MNTIINNIFNFILGFIISFIKLILLPIDAIIVTYLPDVDNLILNVSNFFNIAFSSVGWVLDLLAITPEMIQTLIIYYSFILVAPYLIWLIKVVVKWFSALK